ncbi:hypothetical protein ZOSMA_116G00100 [Zostera marina]|uniref:Uncharacterized protein n=1 Tax=Zostera marina TaxID=29655 RepID=A0A0K9Q499_ZOSMR|nr:hypothetical protein ZOSMA_116G00100 [Zostera marina]
MNNIDMTLTDLESEIDANDDMVPNDLIFDDKEENIINVDDDNGNDVNTKNDNKDKWKRKQ